MFKKESDTRFRVLSSNKRTWYLVNFDDPKNPNCDCPDHQIRKVKCKHILEVKLADGLTEEEKDEIRNDHVEGDYLNGKEEYEKI